MDLIELYNEKFVNKDNYFKCIELIQNNLRRIDYFGSRVHGKSSVNLYISKNDKRKEIIRFASQLNQLVNNGIINEIVLRYKHLRCVLTKPLLVTVAGIDNFSEDIDPIILKLICENYSAQPLRINPVAQERSNESSYTDDPSYDPNDDF